MRIKCKTQNTQEWFSARCGIVTGSNLWKVMNFVAKGSVKRGDKRIESSEVREQYKEQIVAEIMTGIPKRNYVSPYMDEGRENEPLARAAYMMYTGELVETTGLVLHPTMDRFGSSPDSFSKEGVQEYKCPTQETHVRMVLRHMQHGMIPPGPKHDEEYIYQVDAEILCCEKEWCDFATFCPAMSRDYQLFAVRRYRDEQRMKDIEESVARFNEEVLEAIEQFKKLGKPLPEVPEQQWPADLTDKAYSFIDGAEIVP